MKAASQAGRPLALQPPRDGRNIILSTSRPIVLPLNPRDQQGTRRAPNIKAASCRVAGLCSGRGRRCLHLGPRASPAAPTLKNYRSYLAAAEQCLHGALWMLRLWSAGREPPAEGCCAGR